jgi:hypothetical protein
MKLKEEEVHEPVKGDCVEETISRSGEEVDPGGKEWDPRGTEEVSARFAAEVATDSLIRILMLSRASIIFFS